MKERMIRVVEGHIQPIMMEGTIVEEEIVPVMVEELISMVVEEMIMMMEEKVMMIEHHKR